MAVRSTLHPTIKGQSLRGIAPVSMAYGPGQDPLAESVTCRSGLASLRDGWGSPLGSSSQAWARGGVGLPDRGLAEGNVRWQKGRIGMLMRLNRVETTVTGCKGKRMLQYGSEVSDVAPAETQLCRNTSGSTLCRRTPN